MAKTRQGKSGFPVGAVTTEIGRVSPSLIAEFKRKEMELLIFLFKTVESNASGFFLKAKKENKSSDRKKIKEIGN